jgi:hypothetical protein
MTIIRSRTLREREYRRRNRNKLRAKEQTRRDNRRSGPRMCRRCQVVPAASLRHHYCEDCKTISDAARPTRPGWSHERDDRTAAERGYGAFHAKQRARWAKIIDAGDGYCARCGGHIAPGSRWHLDHRDDRQGYLGPSHARCNISAAARKRSVRRSLAQPPGETPNHSRAWLAA